MKKLISWIGDTILIVAAIYCTISTVTSAFAFYIDTSLLLVVCIVAAAVMSGLATLWRAKGLLVCLPVVLVAVLLKMPEIVSGAKWTLHIITDAYSVWAPIDPAFIGSFATTDELLVFFVAVAAVLALLLSMSVTILHSASLTFLLTFPMLAVTILDVNFTPDYYYMIGLLAVYLTLLIGSALYPEDYAKRGVTVFPSAALAIVLLAVVYLVSSPLDHSRSGFVESMDNFVRGSYLETIKRPAASSSGVGWPERASDTWQFDTDSVTVADAGERETHGVGLLEVVSDQSGTYYLRGYSMVDFDGRSWSERSEDEAQSGLQPAKIIEEYYDQNRDEEIELSRIFITQTGDSSDVSYLPYYHVRASGGDTSEIWFLNPKHSVAALAAELGEDSVDPISGDYAEHVRQTYLSVAEDTADGLLELAAEQGIEPGGDRAATADKVASYISRSARYTLNPDEIPEDEDSVLYFLREAREGYCIHFATAATLMLRSLDIPARFTSGFTVKISGDDVGETVTVTDGQAHAWVEVYYDNVGWVPLEVTPSAATNGIDNPGRHSAPVEESETPETERPETSPPVPETEKPDDDDPSPSPSPKDGDKGDGTKASGKGEVSAAAVAIIVVAVLAASVAGMIVRSNIARRRRAASFRQANTNAAVISAWRHIERLASAPSPQLSGIEEIALKARFSRHVVSEQERSAVIEFADALTEETYRVSGLFRRLWLHVVRGI